MFGTRSLEAFCIRHKTAHLLFVLQSLTKRITAEYTSSAVALIAVVGTFFHLHCFGWYIGFNIELLEGGGMK